MEQNMKVNGYKERNLVSESKFGQMDPFMKVIGRIIKLMAKEKYIM